MQTKRCVLAALMLGSFVSSASFARLRHFWSFDELMAKADLVVIADVDKSRMTGERWEWDSEVYKGKTTTFTAVSVLKGEKLKAPLEVLTFVYSEGDRVPSGPVVVELQSNRDRGVAGPHYLMFLKKSPDGRYEPLSGRADADCSIKVVGEAERGD